MIQICHLRNLWNVCHSCWIIHWVSMHVLLLSLTTCGWLSSFHEEISLMVMTCFSASDTSVVHHCCQLWCLRWWLILVISTVLDFIGLDDLHRWWLVIVITPWAVSWFSFASMFLILRILRSKHTCDSWSVCRRHSWFSLYTCTSADFKCCLNN
jgi:hypothetical protein